MAETEFETRYEWLRPDQLIARRDQCPLAILPVGPLEYHGPHLPLGTDAINATHVAHAACCKLAYGVVLPTLYAGTERERDPACLQALGFAKDDYIVGMDFPSRRWNSHYLPEEIFALSVSWSLHMLIQQNYRYIFIANGHGALNHKQVLERLCVAFSHETSAQVDFCLTLDEALLADNSAGHAEAFETSLMMYYNADSVDIDTLPPQPEPLHYTDYSIVDGNGFTPSHDPEHIVRNADPRDATRQQGQALFEAAADQLVARIETLCKKEP